MPRVSNERPGLPHEPREPAATMPITEHFQSFGHAPGAVAITTEMMKAGECGLRELLLLLWVFMDMPSVAGHCSGRPSEIKNLRKFGLDHEAELVVNPVKHTVSGDAQENAMKTFLPDVAGGTAIQYCLIATSVSALVMSPRSHWSQSQAGFRKLFDRIESASSNSS
jgi:hypothetical protein